MDTMAIGETARQAGVNIQTLHYYERLGLLPKPSRTAGNYRLYSQDSVRRIRFVKRAQELGFSLGEIKELLALRAAPGARCEKVRKRAQAKIEDITEKMETLKAMRKALSRLLKECSGQASITDCPILESLERGNE